MASALGRLTIINGGLRSMLPELPATYAPSSFSCRMEQK
jgi:hypothetical protein